MNLILAMLICIAFLAGFGTLYYYSYKVGMSGIKSVAVSSVYGKWMFAAVSFFGFCVCVYVLSQNRFVYFWDYGGYWTNSYATMGELFQDPIPTLQNVYRTVVEEDYNFILPVLISLPLEIFGYTFTRYVLINFLLFLVPVWFVLLSLCEKVLRKSGGSESFFGGTFISIMILSFPVLYYAMLYGFIDVACLLPASLAILLFVDYDPLVFERRQIIRDVLISVLLLNTFLFRRYFLTFIVGYVAALAFYSFFCVFRKRKEKDIFVFLRNAILNYVLIGLTAGIIMSVFFMPLLMHMFVYHYSDKYVSYDLPWRQKISAVIRRFGGLNWLLGFFSAVLSAVLKKYRKMTFFLLLSVIVTAGSFFMIQKMGMQHFYIITIQMFLLLFFSIELLSGVFRDPVKKKIFQIAVLLILFYGLVFDFVPKTRIQAKPLQMLYAEEYVPLKRDDIEELENLADYLNSLNPDQDKHIYIAASNFILNSSIIDGLGKPFNYPRVPNVYWTANIDLVDGFPKHFFNADIVVASPETSSEKVVQFFSSEIMDPSSPIGRHFEKTDREFTLDNSTKVYTYVKTSDYEKEDLEYVLDYFEAEYPEYPELFEDRIRELLDGS